MRLKEEENGFSALHKACLQGHEDIARIMLNTHPQLAQHFNNLGYLPIHLVAINGKTSIFVVFMDLAPLSFMEHTKLQGQTIVHLTIQYDQFDAFLSLVNFFRHTQIFPSVDQDGNSPLYVAVLRGRHKVT